jgi:hypothetical protein
VRGITRPFVDLIECAIAAPALSPSRKTSNVPRSSDKALAQELVDLIEEGIGVPEEEIFCPPLEGYGIPSGKKFITCIKEQLIEPKVVVYSVYRHRGTLRKNASLLPDHHDRFLQPPDNTHLLMGLQNIFNTGDEA